jgi:AbrB family looped-hinge helix DNA binding protein
MAISKVGKKYTLVIPQEVRTKVSIKEGEQVVWKVEGEKLIIKPVSFTRLTGIVKSSAISSSREVGKALEKEIRKDAEEAF